MIETFNTAMVKSAGHLPLLSMAILLLCLGLILITSKATLSARVRLLLIFTNLSLTLFSSMALAQSPMVAIAEDAAFRNRYTWPVVGGVLLVGFIFSFFIQNAYVKKPILSRIAYASGANAIAGSLLAMLAINSLQKTLDVGIATGVIANGFGVFVIIRYLGGLIGIKIDEEDMLPFEPKKAAKPTTQTPEGEV